MGNIWFYVIAAGVLYLLGVYHNEVSTWLTAKVFPGIKAAYADWQAKRKAP